MLEMDGVIDFDLVHTIVTIEDDYIYFDDKDKQGSSLTSL